MNNSYINTEMSIGITVVSEIDWYKLIDAQKKSCKSLIE